MKPPLRLIIADDQALMRDGLQTILELQPDLEVAGTAENGLQALEMARALKPDLVLLDIEMPVMNGIECTRRLKEEAPDTVVLLLSTFAEDKYILDGLSNGASGYLLKDMEGHRLIEAVRDAASGKLMMPAVIAAKLAASLTRRTTAAELDAEARGGLRRELRLTDREAEVAKLMTEGMTNKQIAKELFMHEGTVRNYVSVIYSKIGVSDRAKALLALQDWLTRP
ncbi:DNA-binding response regulator, NarL/FixJ family, contains REC and HTH domains [Paenibacillus sp. UNC496MF]|uniref:response regulator n=1 Tax=Paenibacillus sp. UNC496MF TaxID=1502753 RepID=UPI0008EE984C|nr:response regulator transcription factor [Paenibacillus sp. UNC496MF]SFJ34056.1 DNA-binding response regulator, NarL/FixJ family, contains REC and HTH domains [Paenibacillus sp. UNC496MF]